jgi:hypothetical protein
VFQTDGTDDLEARREFGRKLWLHFLDLEAGREFGRKLWLHFFDLEAGGEIWWKLRLRFLHLVETERCPPVGRQLFFE